MAQGQSGMAPGVAQEPRPLARISMGRCPAEPHSADTSAAAATPGACHLRPDMGRAGPRRSVGDGDLAARAVLADHDGHGVRLDAVSSAAVGRDHRARPDLPGGGMAAAGRSTWPDAPLLRLCLSVALLLGRAPRRVSLHLRGVVLHSSRPRSAAIVRLAAGEPAAGMAAAGRGLADLGSRGALTAEGPILAICSLRTAPRTARIRCSVVISGSPPTSRITCGPCQLNGRARYRAVGAEHAAIARLGSEQVAARETFE